jgi:LacI family transcriptional regulator
MICCHVNRFTRAPRQATIRAQWLRNSDPFPTKPMRVRPTLADVAKAAGVSKTTASLSLNGREVRNVSTETQRRIHSVALELGFQPHALARALSRRRADVIGVVGAIDPFVHESHHLFEHGVLTSIFRRTLECGLNPLVYRLPSLQADASSLATYTDGRSDGFILLNPPADCPLTTHLHEANIPAVTICYRNPLAGGLWVDSDNEAGIEMLLNHLVSLGHRKIGYFVGPGREGNAVARRTAFRGTLQSLGIAVNERWIVRFLWDFDCTLELVDQMFATDDHPTALLAWNDYAAEHICRALQIRGFRVPEDVSVAGFDDTPKALLADPPLTTIRQDLALLGHSAVDLAMQAIEGDGTQKFRPVTCPVELVVRNSTGPITGPT